MKEQTIQILITSFVVLLLGVVLVSIVADNANTVTQKTLVTETLSLAPAIINATYINQTPISLSSHTLYSGFRTDYSECEVTALNSVTNYSGTVKTTPLKYNFTKASGSTPASITISNAVAVDTAKDWISATSNTSTVTYNYCSDQYVGGWAKTVTNLVPGFFVLAILGASLFVALWVLKNEGVEIGI